MANRGVKERFDLCAEWLDVLHFQNLRANAGPWARVRLSQITDRSVVRCIVDHNIVARLKEAHLTNFFRADARGSYICDSPSRKFDPRVRGVNSTREDWNADGVHAGNLDVGPDQPLHNV